MIPRKITEELIEVAREYPVVTINGPRQSGKTTLVRAVFPEHHYCNLEQPDVRALAEKDPRTFLKTYPAPVIFDEIQRVPDLLSYIQVAVDSCKDRGQYILTGSHNLSLHAAITQSLAGRTALLTLWPLSMEELKAAGMKSEREEWIQKGFFPRVYDESLDPGRHAGNYLQTYVERDVRQILQVRDLGQFEQFIFYLAGRTGQLLNYESMANDLGVTGKTLKQWVSVLEASFVIFRLLPYHRNFGKRLVKSAKLYFTDTGFLCHLLGIDKPDKVARDPLLGALFENLVVAEAMKARLNRGFLPHLWFFRDNNGNEVDLLFQDGADLLPIEIKASRTWNNDFLKGIRFLKRSAPNIRSGVVIYSGGMTPEFDGASVIHFENTASVFESTRTHP